MKLANFEFSGFGNEKYVTYENVPNGKILTKKDYFAISERKDVLRRFSAHP